MQGVEVLYKTADVSAQRLEHLVVAVFEAVRQEVVAEHLQHRLQAQSWKAIQYFRGKIQKK